MKSINVRFLATEDIQSLIGQREIIDITEDAYRRTGLGEIVTPTKVSIPLPGNNEQDMHWINSMPSFLKAENIAGIKWVNVTSQNRKKGLPVTMATFILNDGETASPVAIMDGTWITHMRTGASVAIGAKHFARKNSEVVTIIGAGSEGHSAFGSISQLFNIRKLNIIDINKAAAKAFVEKEKKDIQCEYCIYDDAAKAVRDADITVLTTTARKPILNFNTAKPGDFICTISCMTDLDAAYVEKSDKFIVDDIHCALSRISAMSGLNVTPQDIHGDICEILSGQKPGRQSDHEIITWSPAGMGGVDVAVAAKVYQRAADANIGVQLPLIRDMKSLLM